MNVDKRLLHRARDAKGALVLTIGLGFLGGIFTVLQARYLSKVVHGAFLEHQGLRDLSPTLLLLVGVILVRSLMIWGSEVSAGKVAARVKQTLRDRLFAHLLALGPTYARGERTGELTNTVVEGVEALDAYFRQYLPQLALSALVPLTILVFVFPLDFLSGLVLLLTAPLIPVFMVLIGKLADALTRRQWESLSRMSAHFLDVLQGLTTLKLLGQSRAQVRAVAQISDRFRRTTLGVLRVAFLSALVLEMVATISTAVVAVEIGLRLLYGRLYLEQAFFVLLLAPEFYLPLRNLGARFHAGMSGVAAARRIFEVLETPLPVSAAATREVLPPLHVDIRFQEVHYAYEEDRRPALNGISFHMAPRQKIALVGPSGAGKSTVASLLLRFIEPDQGQITVDGIPLSEIPAPAWRSQVAWVPQRPYLFHTTLVENIRLARPDATMDAVIQAARQAHAHEFIQALPQGYETVVGEQGARLSGGQAQRIALARAFLKNAPLLILDEATSNLDPEHEALIQEATERLMQGRTVLIIAHRLSTVYRADRIVVLAEGQVAETGTHASLLQQGGLYRRLVTAYGGRA
ncbi:MAG TPA: thiol reductant ABC exporter subunit CydD [Anaerolineae bacterium]|nr:thiol reductant ABC exporter subunit CydD [Anaerolineae bacterium]